MTLAEAKLHILSLPDDLRLVVGHGPRLCEVINLSVREGLFFLEGSIWRPTHNIHVSDGKEVEHRRVKVLEVDF